jgi:Phosphopantetheine attachment site
MGRAHIEAEVRALLTDVARLQMLAAVEKRFALRLPDEDLVRLHTIGRIADVVERLQGRSAS